MIIGSLILSGTVYDDPRDTRDKKKYLGSRSPLRGDTHYTRIKINLRPSAPEEQFSKETIQKSVEALSSEYFLDSPVYFTIRTAPYTKR